MVEELVQNKKNQLKPSKTWEEPAVNFAGWVDLPFLLLILPSCKLPTGSSGRGTGKQPPEIQKWWENCPSLWEQPFGLDKQSWMALGDAHVLQPLGEQCRALTWEKRYFDVPMFLCGYLERLKNYKWTGRKFKTSWSGLSECSLEKELWYLNKYLKYLYFRLLTKGAINEIAETLFLTPPCCLNPLSSKKWSLYSNFINITSKMT